MSRDKERGWPIKTIAAHRRDGTGGAFSDRLSVHRCPRCQHVTYVETRCAYCGADSPAPPEVNQP